MDKVNDAVLEMYEKGIGPERWQRTWLHTHPDGMTAHPSMVDEDTFATYAGLTYSCMIILSKSGHWYGRARITANDLATPSFEAEIPLGLTSIVVPDRELLREQAIALIEQNVKPYINKQWVPLNVPLTYERFGPSGKEAYEPTDSEYARAMREYYGPQETFEQGGFSHTDLEEEMLAEEAALWAEMLGSGFTHSDLAVCNLFTFEPSEILLWLDNHGMLEFGTGG